MPKSVLAAAVTKTPGRSPLLARRVAVLASIRRYGGAVYEISGVLSGVSVVGMTRLRVIE